MTAMACPHLDRVKRERKAPKSGERTLGRQNKRLLKGEGQCWMGERVRQEETAGSKDNVGWGNECRVKTVG
jgi:hypothetical protein